MRRDFDRSHLFHDELESNGVGFFVIFSIPFPLSEIGHLAPRLQMWVNHARRSRI
jgi:hypothetical protein